MKFFPALLGVIGLSYLGTPLFAASFRVGMIQFDSPPDWVEAKQTQKTIDRIEHALEWDIRKTRVEFIPSETDFRRLFGFDSEILAFAKTPIETEIKSSAVITVGPQVRKANWDKILGHELVHVIIGQKFKTSIPDWLEEGLANYFGKNEVVDYTWLSAQPLPAIEKLGHPVTATSENGGLPAHFYYQASQALVELLDTKCGGADQLLQLALGKSVKIYLSSLCGIEDLHRELRAWIDRKARALR